MLKVFISNTSKILSKKDVTYKFPENSLSPWEQFAWMDEHLKEFIESDVSISTFSPYILNYLNLLIVKGELDFEKLEVVNLFYDIEDFNSENHVSEYNLKIFLEKDPSVKLIDTRNLSEPIDYIYENYEHFRNSNKIKIKTCGITQQ